MSLRAFLPFGSKRSMGQSLGPSVVKKEEILPIYEANLGWAYGCSRTGASHLHSATPCQDAYSIWSGSVAGMPCLIVAVADGHGDKRHDLSQYGASFAVKAAVDELLSFYTHFGVDGSPSSLKSNFKAGFPRRVGRQWRDFVLKDATARIGEIPSDPDENHKVFTRYGTTLLVALTTSDAVLLGQIGDGDILLISSDGDIESPFQKDTSLVGTATYSLSSNDAQQLWQTATLERSGGGVLLMATDGLANAFADDVQFHTFARSLLDRIKEFGMQKIAASIPHWLNSFSEKGSGDDITLALACFGSEQRAGAGKDPTPKDQDTETGPMETNDATGNRTVSESGDAERQPDREEETR